MIEPIYNNNGITLYHGDCLTVMPELDAGAFDAVIADIPYGTTACAWDTVIPFAPMWDNLERLARKRAAHVLFGSQPFTSALIASNFEMFRYSWVWDKVNLFTNHMNADIMPMRQHEDICIFSSGHNTYNDQKRKGKPYSSRGVGNIEVYAMSPRHGVNLSGEACAATILSIPAIAPGNRGLHPTQKPLALMEYLIRTYTNENDLILDFTCGSGTTLRAAKNLKRRAVGIEKERHYCDVTIKRLEPAFEQAIIDNGATLEDLPMFAIS